MKNNKAKLNRIIKLIVSLVLVFGLVLISGCGKKKKFEGFTSGGTLVKLSKRSILQNEDYLEYTLQIEITTNGMVTIEATDFPVWYSEGDIPSSMTSITPEQIEEIKKLIEDNKIFYMRDKQGTKDASTGTEKFITVYFSNATKTVGGVNPSRREFVNVYDGIMEMIRNDVMSYEANVQAIQKNAKEIYGTHLIRVDKPNGQTLVDNADIVGVFKEEVENEDGSTSYMVYILLDEDGTAKYKDYTEEGDGSVTVFINYEFYIMTGSTDVVEDGKIRLRLCETVDEADQMLLELEAGLAVEEEEYDPYGDHSVETTELYTTEDFMREDPTEAMPNTEE